MDLAVLKRGNGRSNLNDLNGGFNGYFMYNMNHDRLSWTIGIHVYLVHHICWFLSNKKTPSSAPKNRPNLATVKSSPARFCESVFFWPRKNDSKDTEMGISLPTETGSTKHGWKRNPCGCTSSSDDRCLLAHRLMIGFMIYGWYISIQK